MARSRAAGSDFRALVRWPAWGLALLAFASAFTTLGPGLMHGLRWALFIGSILLAGLSMGEGRRVPFFLYGVLALLVNPIVPFQLAPEIWRFALAAGAIWLVADNLKSGD
jgi:uncharacterized protein YhhL (DUF1145 family)